MTYEEFKLYFFDSEDSDPMKLIWDAAWNAATEAAETEDLELAYMAGQASRIPEGYALVPIEPTEAMLDTGCTGNINVFIIEQIYKDMILAAQENNDAS